MINIPKIPMRLTLDAVPEDPTDLPAYLETLIDIIQQQNNIIATILNTMQGAGDPSLRPPAPTSVGATYYDNILGQLYVWDGAVWNTV